MSDTVKSDCPIQSFMKMINYLKVKYRLLVHRTSLIVCSEDIKHPTNPKSVFPPVNLIKKNLALSGLSVKATI